MRVRVYTSLRSTVVDFIIFRYHFMKTGKDSKKFLYKFEIRTFLYGRKIKKLLRKILLIRLPNFKKVFINK